MEKPLNKSSSRQSVVLSLLHKKDANFFKKAGIFFYYPIFRKVYLALVTDQFRRPYLLMLFFRIQENRPLVSKKLTKKERPRVP